MTSRIWFCGLVGAFGILPTRAHGQARADATVVARFENAVVSSSPEVQAHRAAAAAARARVRVAGAASPASVSVDADEVPGGRISDAQSVGGAISWDLFTAGRRPLRRAAAERDVDEASVRLSLAERRVAAQAQQFFVRLVSTTGILGRLEAEDSLLDATAQALQARFAVGEARYVDVLRLRTERLRVQTDAAATASLVSSHRRALLALAPAQQVNALEPLLDSALTVALRDPFGRVWPPAAPLDTLVAHAPASLLGATAVDRAIAAQRTASAEGRVLIGASLGIRRFAAEGGDFATGPSIALSATLPFTSPSGSRGRVLAADRDVEVARATLAADARRAGAELGAARDRYEAARHRLAIFGAALLQGARDEREAALAAYRNGDLSLLELIDFERTLARAEVMRFETLMEAAHAWAELQGGGL